MMKLAKQAWWKIVGVIALVYSLVAGFLIPLGPGVSAVFPDRIENVKQVKLELLLQNNRATEDDAYIVLLRYGDFYIPPTQFHVEGESAEATFNLPFQQLYNDSVRLLDVIVNNPTDGTFALRDAITVWYTSDFVENNDENQIPALSLSGINDDATYICVPNRERIRESIRNLFFHVPMWFGMVLLLLFGVICSVMYLSKSEMKYDVYTDAVVRVALVFGVLGFVTGMVWGHFAWGDGLPNDVRINGALVAMLIYFAYLILRGSLKDEIARAKTSAVYNIFAFVLFIVFIFVVPRLSDTVHPGTGGNPGFNQYDLDNTMRMIFYPAVIGWTIIGFWIASIKIRFTFINDYLTAKSA